MSDPSDDLVERLRLLGRANEEGYFRKLDQSVIERLEGQAIEARESEQALRAQLSKLLVAVDFSPYSKTALQYAAALATGFGSSVTAIHVIDTELLEARAKVRYEETPFVPDYVVMIEEDALERLIHEEREGAYKALAEFIPAQLVKHELELRVLMGKVFERIVETAEREHWDLIVMGTHGRTGWSRLVAGSIAERVVRLAPCPVLTVKDKTVEGGS